MKEKEGRDYLQFIDCVAGVTDGGYVCLRTMSETILLTPDEFERLVKFVAAHKGQI